MRERHGRVLWVVLAINALLFLAEGWAGMLAHSTSLLADALDMLGDALVYGSYALVSRWPDIVVGGIIASLFLGSAFSVMRQSTRALRTLPTPTAPVSQPVAVRLP